MTPDGYKFHIDGRLIRDEDPAGTGCSAWPAVALLRVGRHIWQLWPDRVRRLTRAGT